MDAETSQYYAEIASLLATYGSITNREDRASLCANALEETQGKELELACDKSCSRVLEMLVDSCDIIQVTSFLHRISPCFPIIANDSSGSHVAEAVLKSVAAAVQGYDGECAWYTALKQALVAVCQAMGERAADMMSNCYGSHVLRSLLSLLSGATLETSSDKKIRRLSISTKGNVAKCESIPFPDLLHNLVEKLLEAAKKNVAQLHEDPFTSPVLQAILKILKGNDASITRAIMMLLDCDSENVVEDDIILSCGPSRNLKQLMFDNTGSHLVEVMLEVAPDAVYTKLFQEICSHNVLEFSLHRSANFVVQSLITSVRHQDQVNLLFEALRPSFLKLIKEMRSGVVSSILIACKRFCTCEHEACQVLAHAICRESDPPACLVPRLLFLESYAKSESTSDWKPVFGKKLSVLGCAMLQTIFSFSKECNQQFCLSFTALEAAGLLAMVKDSGGCHVFETFLISSVPWEHKNNAISKLVGHFGELALCMLSSFTVEKCFSVGDITLKEAIASELALVQPDLEKTKHGPHLIKKCDIMGYSSVPDQWRRRMTVKQDTLQAFSDAFNPGSKLEVNNGKKGVRKSESLRVAKPGKQVNREVLDITKIASVLGSERKRKSFTSEGNVLAIDPKQDTLRAFAKTQNPGSTVDNGKNNPSKCESLDTIKHVKQVSRAVLGANKGAVLPGSEPESTKQSFKKRRKARHSAETVVSDVFHSGSKTDGKNNASTRESLGVARCGRHLSGQVLGADKALGLEPRSTWEFKRRKRKAKHSVDTVADTGNVFVLDKMKKAKRKASGVDTSIIMKESFGSRKLKKKIKSMQHN